MELASRGWVWEMVLVCLFLSHIIDGHGISGAGMSIAHNLDSSKLLSLPQSEGTARTNHARGRKLTASWSDRVSSSREVGALLAFKDSVTSDPLGALDSWQANDTDPCLWRGVRCLSRNVVGLNLSSLQFVGIIPEMLGYLNFLERLDLSNNFLSGSIPDSIANCSNLAYVNISFNQVSGNIPSQIGGLLHLLTLSAYENNLTGVIPETIGNCSSLELLNLEYNSLEGVIPLHISQLSSLAYLNLRRNLLSGSIPCSLGNCSSLSSVFVGRNFNLGGELPHELSQLTKMRTFDVEFCNFDGAFPTWVTNLTSLSYFYLNQNSFSGEIPSGIGQLSQTLIRFVLFSNQLSGPIPTSIVNCTSLVWLELQQNNLTGNVPPNIGFLSNVEYLGLSENRLSGVIPPSISNCSALTTLTLGYNPMSRQRIPLWIESLSNLEQIWFDGLNLYGEIPAWLGKLSSLNTLSISQNYLAGGLPSSLGNLSVLQVLQVFDNELQGEIPSEITGNLSALTYLILSGNFFVGSIPSFRDLHELTNFNVDFNLFTGYTDSNLGIGALQLQYFSLGDNRFSGPLPEQIGNFSKLQGLGLAGNMYSGSIPRSWGNLTNLQHLTIAYNEVEGEIPADLFRCIHLLLLNMLSNRLEGSIPWAIGQVVSLEILLLDYNFFSGMIPLTFANLTKLQKMDLGFNRFSGTIPGSALSKMGSSLLHLALNDNLFSGFWPSEFNLLINLQRLLLGKNNLSGPMQQGLVACRVLSVLDVSHNNLTGMIPPDLGLLQQLQFFNASFNNFEGPIPTMGLFKTRNISRTSFLGNLKLCGSTSLVSQPCSLTSSKHSGKTFNALGRWILLGFSLLTVLLIFLLAVVGSLRGWHKKNRHIDYLIKNFDLQGRIVLSEEEVMRIIQGGEDHVIGRGAKSTVYKGDLSTGETIALKVLHNEFRTKDLDEMDKRATEELLREVHTLASLRHLNITKILGLVISADVKALILEYMPRGNLHDLLYNELEAGQILCLQDRLKITLGIAESLVYLHHSSHDPIIHSDLKPSNVLLGIDLQPKLNDFGISRMAKQSISGKLEATASTVCGTFGYIPPEYATQATVSTRGDVYSFGVVLLELLTRKSPTSEGNFGPSGDLVSFVADSFEDRPLEVLDSTLMQEWETSSIAKDQTMLLLRVGLLCTRWAAKARPDMKDVLEMLKQIKDMELEEVPLRSVEELAHDITVWNRVGEAAGNDMGSASSS